MQAYRQDYCDNGSQQQMYRKSQSSQSYLHSSGGSGMHHQQHHHGGSMMHPQQHHGGVGGSMMHHQGGGVGGSMMHHQGGGLVSGGGSMMQLHKTSSMNSHQYSSSSSSSSTTVFGQDAFCDIMPSSFPPGTDPKVIECYNRIDRDGNGIIDDMELQSVLSNCNHSFSMRTVHLLMFDFTHSNKRVIGPKEFLPLLKCLQSWRAMFQRFDRDRNGSIDSSELGQALSSLGYRVSPVIINLLAAKFSKSGHHHNSYRCSLQYDSFIECCLTVKGLTETFNAKAECGKASFCYEEFLLNVLPFIIA